LAAVTSAFADVPFAAERDWPRVSVVVCTFNGSRTLRATLEGIQCLEYPELEVIVVDDGSTDATAELAESYPGLRCIRQENAGAAVARNTAIAAASGELVANLDSDDILPPRRLSVQASYLVAHPEVGCVFGRQEWLNPPPWLGRDQVYGDLDGIPLSSAMFRRKVLLDLGGYDQAFAPSEDTDLVIRMREAGIPYHVLPEVVLYRRYHESSLTGGRAPQAPLLRSLRAKMERERARPDTPQ
jgi:glycosyltransferase involved in cell wall biosynthesis